MSRARNRGLNLVCRWSLLAVLILAWSASQAAAAPPWATLIPFSKRIHERILETGEVVHPLIDSLTVSPDEDAVEAELHRVVRSAERVNKEFDRWLRR